MLRLLYIVIVVAYIFKFIVQFIRVFIFNPKISKTQILTLFFRKLLFFYISPQLTSFLTILFINIAILSPVYLKLKTNKLNLVKDIKKHTKFSKKSNSITISCSHQF